jgi:TolB-like protein/class 3 adenylate cyclase/Tfp pilus assembly protein PilF
VAKERVQRRLAAILAADVVGYSRLIEADEEGTRARLRSLHADLIDPQIADDSGRIVKTTGDGILVEFPSAVAAVRNALAIQSAIAGRNSDMPEDRRIRFRVGINVGDVIVEGDDIHGDGVNVAARLEGLCEPGEVFVSGTVFDQAAGKLSSIFDDLGEQRVKNISKPLRIYRVRNEGPKEAERGRRAKSSAEPEKPSIAVLPFVNMSGDPDQEYFADGMVDEIITSLSRFPWLIVTARTSSFEYKGQNIDVREIARKLGVRYILEGSVRKAGHRVRIIGQLLDAVSGAHLWADRIDGDLDDIFDLQDKVTENVVGAIEPRLRLAEIERAKRKAPGSLDAYDYYLQALSHYYNRTSRASVQEGLRLIDLARATDPGFAPANALAAWFHYVRFLFHWSSSPAEDIEEGLQLARAGLDGDPGDPFVLCNCGWVLVTLGHDFENGVAAINKALDISPNSAPVLSTSGFVLTLVGDQELALKHWLKAARISPSDPHAYRHLTGAAIASVLMGRYADAVSYGEQARRHYAKWAVTFRILAAAYAQLGQYDQAHEALARMLEFDPAATISQLKKALPYQDPEQAERLWDGLRNAGLPE